MHSTAKSLITMKVPSVLLISVALLVSTRAQEAAQKYRSECLQETGVEEALVDRADGGDFATDPKLYCFAKCFYQKTGFVDADGNLLLDAIKAQFPQEAEAKKRAEEVLEECKGLTGGDTCETVFLIHKCYFEKSRGKE